MRRHSLLRRFFRPRRAPRQAGDRDLLALRRHQRRLLFGGGGMFGAAILAALFALFASLVEDVQTRRIDEFHRARLALDTALIHRDAAHLRLRNLAEYAWNHRGEGEPLPARELRQRFLAERERAVVSAGEDSLPQMALGLDTARWAPAKLESYLAFARSLSVITHTAITGLEAGEETAYFHDPDGAFFALSHGLTEQALDDALGTRDRAVVFARLRAFGEAAKAARNDGRGTAPIRTRFGPHPTTGVPSVIAAFTAVHDGVPFGTFVSFEPAERFAQVLREAGEGQFMLLSSDGSLVFDTQPAAEGDAAAALRRAGTWSAWRAGLSVQRANGWFYIAGTVRGTDWSLVHAYSWRDILRETGMAMSVAGAVALLMLGGLWYLLARLDRRVFAPALARAGRVYQSEEVSRALIDLSPVGLCLIDAEQASAALQNDLVRRYAEGMAGAGRSLYRELAQGFLGIGDAPGGRPEGKEFQLSVPDADGAGARHLLVAATRATYRNRPVLLCALRDLTARVELEAQQKRARMEAEAASRAKSAFVATMSHEIRTPLHGVLGHLELLARSPLSASQHEHLRRINQSAGSLLSILSDVLDFSKIEAGQLDIEQVPFEPAELLERVALLYAPLALAKGLELDCRLDAAMARRYRGGEARIEQVLRNLLCNALKFTASGRIALRATSLFRDGGEYLRFQVADSGIGLTEEQRDRLFRPFVQADESIAGRFGGTGLGLSLCRRLCELMGGTITVDSTPGVGSVFTFVVPVARLASPEAPKPLAGSTVVLMAAAAGWRDELGRRLRSWGARVRLAAGPDELDTGDAVAADALVVFERAGTRLETAGRVVAGCLVRVRPDGPLQPEWRDGAWLVSCYAADALLQVLRQEPPAARAVAARRSRIG